MIVATGVIGLWLWSVSSVDFLSNDGAQYLSTVDQILAGHGVRTTTIYYDVQASNGIPALQTIWPPGLPALVALVAKTARLSSASAYGLVNAAAHGATVLLVYWILRRWLAITLAAAMACGLLFYSVNWQLALGGLSEPLFTFCAIIASASLVKAFETNRPSHWWLAVAGLATGATFLVRYVGIAFAGSLALVALFEWRRRTDKKAALVDVAMLLGPAALLISGLFLRNLMGIGRLTGAVSAARGPTVPELMFQTKWALVSLLGGGETLPARATGVMLLAAGSAWITCVILDARRGAKAHTFTAGRQAVAVYALSGAAGLIVLVYTMALRKTGVSIEGRYFAPCIPMLLIGAAASWPASTKSMSRWRRPLAVAVAVFTVALLALNALAVPAWLQGNTGPRQIARALGAEHQSQTLRQLLTEAASDNTPVLSNQSQALHIVLRRPTLGVPERRLTPTVWSPDEILRVARRFGSRHLVIFRAMPLGGRDGSEDYVWRIAGREPPGLIKVHQDESVILYQISPR